jgi:hypothetical protein
VDRGFVIPRFSTPRLLLVNGCPRDACGREAAGRATRDADARGKDAGVAHPSHARATRARFARTGLDSRLARAYLRVLLGRPLFFFYRRVDLVAPPLRALLAGLPGKLRGDERPSVAVNFLETAGRKDGASASREVASDASVASRASARGTHLTTAASAVTGEENKMRVKALLREGTHLQPREFRVFLDAPHR